MNLIHIALILVYKIIEVTGKSGRLMEFINIRPFPDWLHK